MITTDATEHKVKISVLLVCYNQRNLIARAIEHALGQQCSLPYEIIVADDHSTDGTREICQTYAEQHPDVVHLLPDAGLNLGLNANMLRAFNECSGDYIAYLEGDDYWTDPCKLQKQADILEQCEDIVLVHTNCALLDIRNNRLQPHLIAFEGTCIRETQSGISGVEAEYLGHFRHIKTSTVMYRRRIMQQIIAEDSTAYENKTFPTQDFQLFNDMAYRGRFAFINEDTTVIGLHDSISAAIDEPRTFNFHRGFFDIGIYYIDKYKLRPDITYPWFKKELHWFLNHAMNHSERIVGAMDAVCKAKQHHYNMPATQRALCYILQHEHLRRIIYPLYKRYATHREAAKTSSK